MLESELYLDNLFVDISYVIFHYQDNINTLKVLPGNPRLRRSVLFGTDYYMVETEKFSEKELSMYLRLRSAKIHIGRSPKRIHSAYLFGDDQDNAEGPCRLRDNSVTHFTLPSISFNNASAEQRPSRIYRSKYIHEEFESNLRASPGLPRPFKRRAWSVTARISRSEDSALWRFPVLC